MVYIPITEAVKRLGKSDRQVRRMVHSGKLTYRYAPDKKLEILSSDVDKWIRHALPAQELERLDRLEQDLIQLRERLDTLSSRVDAFIIPREKAAPRPVRTQPGPSEQKSTMPADLVGWRAFSRLHNIGASTVQGAIARGELPLVKGKWKVGQATIEGAFDATGRHDFYEKYHKWPRYQPCEQCPHMLAGVS